MRGQFGPIALTANAGALLLGIVLLVGGAFASEARPDAAPDSSDLPLVRVVYTTSMYGAIPENDVKAAIKVWTATMAAEYGVRATIVVDVVDSAAELADRVRTGRAEIGGTSAIEFFQAVAGLELDPVFAFGTNDDASVQYVVLVPQNSRYQALADLRGASLKAYDSPRTVLATPWLELELAEAKVGPLNGFFGQVETVSKVSGVILPVFFGQADACLVTGDGFRTMAELNPQVGRQLRVLVGSPPLVPSISFFRRSYQPSFRPELLKGLQTIQDSPTGRQLLNLLQGEQAVILDAAALEPTHALVRRWLDRVSPKNPSKPPRARSLANGGAQ